MNDIKVIPFMRYRHHAAVFSAMLVLIAIVSLATRGLNLGLDFTGGTQLEVSYSDVPELQDIRTTLTEAGYPNHEVIFYGTDRDVLIRLQNVEGTVSEEAGDVAAAIIRLLRESTAMQVELQESGFISSLVGEELREQGGLGMLVALGMIMIYIALRFQFKFSVGAVVSLLHDSIVTLGFFSVTGMNFDLTTLAAVLAVIGYSLNDTIVVFDRIRENFRIQRGKSSEEIIDLSITQTMARSIITSLTTLLVLIALYFFGGEVVRGFSMALIVGVFFGTTSSIYVAAGVLMYMNISKEDLMPPAKEQEELDALP